MSKYSNTELLAKYAECTNAAQLALIARELDLRGL